MSDVREYPVETGAQRLSVRDHPGGSPPILALHGLASNARWWDLVAARLSPRWRVIAPDLRGHGRSDRPETGYAFAEVVDDLRGLVEAAGLDRVIVAGHSWGAAVALWLAAALPERTIACVCVDGGAASLRDHLPTWAEAEERLRPPRIPGLTEETVRAWAANGRIGKGGDAAAAGEILLGNFEEGEDGALRPRLSTEHHMEIARRLYELDAFELMARVSCPVLFVPARSGPWPVEAKAAGLQRARDVLGSRAHIEWLDGGHDLPVERPAELARVMAAFAARVGSDKRA
jgi:pimeloyl-ACP methyl ester carboxylesterase